MKSLILSLALLGFAGLGWAQNANSGVDKNLSDATQVIQNMTTPNAQNGIPQAVLDKAQCIAVVPNMVQAGFIVGGKHGNGVATCRTTGNQWSSPAPISISGGSFGAQIGGGSAQLVMLAMTPQGKQELESGNVKLGAGVSAAGPTGQAAAGANTQAAILTYSHLKGAYAGATISGAQVSQDKAATKELYGREVPLRSILNGQEHSNNVEAMNFRSAVQNSEQLAQAR